MPTAAVNCSQHVMDQLAELNMKALQVQKGKVRTVAIQAVNRRQRAARIQVLKKKVSQVVEIDITGDSLPKNKPSQNDTPADNVTQQPPEKNTGTPAEKPEESTVRKDIHEGDKSEKKQEKKPAQKQEKKPELKEEQKPQLKAEQKKEKEARTEGRTEATTKASHTGWNETNNEERTHFKTGKGTTQKRNIYQACTRL